MAVLRRRERTSDAPPEAEHDLDAVAGHVRAAAAAALGDPPHIDDGPQAVIAGCGPHAYRLTLATDDPAWAGTLVARLSDPDVLLGEAAWIRAVGAAGFPAPDLLTGDDDHARGLLVFRQPPGKTLAEVMVTDLPSLPRYVAAFGRLHARLHDLPPAGPRAVAGSPADDLATRAPTGDVRADVADELAWLAAHRPGGEAAVVCHGELNPVHVYLGVGESGGGVPVNWTRSRLAAPEYDVAATVTAFWAVPLYVDNAVYRRMLKMARESLASSYLAAYAEGAARPVDDPVLAYWQAHHLCGLACDASRRLREGPGGPWDGGRALAQPASALREVRKRFWQLAAEAA
ncbi:MAG TPA: aminoglycoside phosphotransferase family protein [Acidimicrobiales bacterium]|nr:aminoglycoside phosphotransferase family protein [Acidimicrobiales bacterium]